MARSIAPGSSGLGKATVGKSGWGSRCSGTTAGASNPAAPNARASVPAPTPCSGVYAIRSSRASPSGSLVTAATYSATIESSSCVKTPAAGAAAEAEDRLESVI